MLKNLSKFFVTTSMCALLVAGSVSAATYYSNYSTGNLPNSGSSVYYELSGSYNTKKNLTQPWTLYVESIQSQGSYGIRFVPIKMNTDRTRCTQSGRWRNTTGWGTVAWAAGDAELMQYMLGARRDDNTLYTGIFNSTGKWSSDEVK